jgi:hypothetical protein
LFSKFVERGCRKYDGYLVKIIGENIFGEYFQVFIKGVIENIMWILDNIF